MRPLGWPFVRIVEWICPKCGKTRKVVSIGSPPWLFPVYIGDLWEKMHPPLCPRCKTKMIRKPARGEVD